MGKPDAQELTAEMVQVLHFVSGGRSIHTYCLDDAKREEREVAAQELRRLGYLDESSNITESGRIAFGRQSADYRGRPDHHR